MLGQTVRVSACGCSASLRARVTTCALTDVHSGGRSHRIAEDLGAKLLAVAATVATFSNAGAANAADAVEAAKPVDNGLLTPVVDSLDFVLSNIEAVYQTAGVPYSYGWSIVTLTAFVKLLTLPLTKKQVESAMSVQSLKPRIDAIKDRYGEDKDKIQKETSRLYEQAQVNPLAGCLPSLLQLPIFIGLYRSLSNVANSGALDTEGFYWLPSLAGPVSIADRNSGGGVSWLLPIVDGAPPVGWEEASLYLVLPILLVLAQYASSAIISPIDPNDEKASQQRVLIYALPLMIGWFSLNVPSGLSLYYFSNSVFTSAQQIYFRKLGGAQVDTPDLGPVKKLGMGRRTGEEVRVVETKAASELPDFGAGADLAAELGGAATAAASASNGNRAQAPVTSTGAPEGISPEEAAVLERRCKRKKRPQVAA